MNDRILLSAILNCGTADLSILDGVEYDWGDIVDEAREEYGEITLDSLFSTVIDFGISDLNLRIDEKIDELKYKIMNTEDDGKIERLENIIQLLKKVEPQDDFGIYFNYLDTHVCISKNIDIYLNYLGDEIEEFENNTGFDLQY